MGRPKGFEREELLEKVGEVFWKKGFADTSISDLEKATGVAKSGIYSEFKDKNELFTSALRQYIERVGPAESLTREPHGWKNIEDFFKETRECGGGENGCFVSYSLRESAIMPPEANQLVHDYFTGMKSLLEKNLVVEGFKSNAAIVADMIFSFAIGLSLEQSITAPKKMASKVTEFLEMIHKLK